MALSRVRSEGHVGRLYKFDVSVGLEHTDSLLADLRRVLAADGFRSAGQPAATATSVAPISAFRYVELEYCNFGHAGDQNLHLNILASVVVCHSTEVGMGEGVEQSAVPGLLAQVQLIISSHVYRLVLARRGALIALSHVE